MRFFNFRISALAVLAAEAACAGRSQVSPVNPEQQLPAVSRASARYAGTSFTTRSGTLSASGFWTFLGGSGGNAHVFLVVDIPAEGLVFQRSDSSTGPLEARYAVRVSFDGGGKSISADVGGSMKAASFGDAYRAGRVASELISVQLSGGETYQMSVEVIAAGPATRTLRYKQAISVPRFGADSGSTRSAALFVKSARDVRARSSLAQVPEAILRPKPMAGWGDTLTVYLESYDPAVSGALLLRVATESDEKRPVWEGSASLVPGGSLASAVAVIPTDSLPLGYHVLTVSDSRGKALGEFPVIVELTPRWFARNFSRLLKVLERSVFVTQSEIDSLKKSGAGATGPEWMRFWESHDLGAYFRQVAEVNLRFGGSGPEGWETARGEVFLALGSPDEVYNSGFSPVQQRRSGPAGQIEVWMYRKGGREYRFYFVDNTGFGGYVWDITVGNNYGTFAALREQLRKRIKQERGRR